MKRNNKIITCTDSTQFERVSRWITIRSDYNITPKHSLYDVAYDDGKGEKYVDYIIHKGYRIPTSSMYTLGTMWVCEKPHEFIEHNERHVIIAVDMEGDLYDPYYIETDEWGENVRLYKKL